MATLLTIGIALAMPLAAQDAEQIMARTRMGAKLQHNDLEGKLTKSGMSACPVYLFLRGENIQFWCDIPQGRKWERKSFHLRMGDAKPELFENMDGKQRGFPRAKLTEAIAGTDLTYEDLSMRFLYWPNPSIEGEEKVSLFDCWKIRVDNPGNDGAYKSVYVWVSKQHGAFVRVRGHDRNGNLIKQFEVEKVMKLKDGSYTLERMEVASYAKGRVSGRTELTFKNPTRPKLNGPR